ncbi:uncharacterized protein LOC117115577 [Anneissia japonica]|uniref:uncharacterized protein LOC117115577 n=1 Tax=Anneissia japonica TaxID=1529436 RepID=UPI001425A52E|nr:uncharacterized protein LOC117115577 [Anneissia japonica]
MNNDECIQCQLPVTQDEEAVLCEECDRWQHRTCDSGVSREQYMAAVENGSLDWVCFECREDVGLYAADLGEFEEPVEQQDVDLDMLVDSIGYQYNKKVDKRRADVTWRCSVRSKTVMCRATVLERNGEFVRGSQRHICTAEPCREAVALLRRDIKASAIARPFDSAAEIIEQALRDDIGRGNIAMHPTLPKPVNLAQQANRKRKLTRLRQPADLNFVLDEEHVAPGFFQRDIKVDGLRHIMFATEDMLGPERLSRGVWHCRYYHTSIYLQF